MKKETIFNAIASMFSQGGGGVANHQHPDWMNGPSNYRDRSHRVGSKNTKSAKRAKVKAARKARKSNRKK